MQAVGSTTPWMCRQIRLFLLLFYSYERCTVFLIISVLIDKFGVLDLISVMINYCSSKVGCNWDPHFLLATVLLCSLGFL